MNLKIYRRLTEGLGRELQEGRCSLHKHKDLSLIPGTHTRYLVFVNNPSSEEEGTGGSLGPFLIRFKISSPLRIAHGYACNCM